MKSFNNKLALGTSCLGLHASHVLDRKLRAAAGHGFTGVEIVYGDLERYSSINNLSITDGAEQIRSLCEDLGLHILSLCPFENFEGARTPLQERLKIAAHWIDIARRLQATYMQVPAQYGKDVSGDEALIVSELQQLADLGSAAEPVISIAYEPMSWSTHYSTWQSVVQLTKLINRTNFDICLDTFHIASKIWGSPYDPSGKYPNADRNLKEDLHQFLSDFPVEKLSYIQLSDGEKFNPVFSKEHPWYLEGEDAEFTWSKHARPFPLETEYGGYFPMVELVHAWVIEKGFNGWISLETFDRRMRDPNYEIEDGAIRAERSIQKLQKALRAGQTKL